MPDREIDRFEAVDEDGGRYTVICWQTFKGDAPGMKFMTLENGRRVTMRGGDLFEITSLRRMIRRL